MDTDNKKERIRFGKHYYGTDQYVDYGKAGKFSHKKFFNVRSKDKKSNVTFDSGLS